jgi:hypothetical protein
MIKWFNDWFRRKCIEAWEHRDNGDVPLASSRSHNKSNRGLAIEAVSTQELNSRGINFAVYRAEGGIIIELRSYDDRQDRHYNKLYVIHDSQNFAEELDKIITVDYLRK